MMTSTTSKALTIAELISSGKDEMAGQLTSDFTDRLAPDEVDAILNAVYARGEGEDPVGLDSELSELAAVGLPYLTFDNDPYDVAGFTSFLDEILKFVRPTPEFDLTTAKEYREETALLTGGAIYWPFRDNQDFLYTFDSSVSTLIDTIVEMKGSEMVLRNVEVDFGYVANRGYSCYAGYKCDLLVRKNGTVTHIGTPSEIWSDWYGGEVTD